MANSTKLVLKFGTASGVKTWTYNYAKSNATTVNIRALMDGMITNGSVYQYPPLTKESAEIVTTSTTPVDVGD